MKQIYVITIIFLLTGGMFSAGAEEVLDGHNTAGQLHLLSDGAKPFAMDPSRLTVGIYANPLGFLALGPMVGVELTAGFINVDVHLRFPSLGLLMWVIEAGDELYECRMTGGFGAGFTVRYFKHTSNGGFYVGPFIEYSFYTAEYDYGDGYEAEATQDVFAFGGNVGYKFAWNHFYLRLGGYIGAGISTERKWEPNYDESSVTSGDTTIVFFADVSLGFAF